MRAIRLFVLVIGHWTKHHRFCSYSLVFHSSVDIVGWWPELAAHIPYICISQQFYDNLINCLIPFNILIIESNYQLKYTHCANQIFTECFLFVLSLWFSFSLWSIKIIFNRYFNALFLPMHFSFSFSLIIKTQRFCLCVHICTECEKYEWTNKPTSEK